jgi:hypothetical protein
MKHNDSAGVNTGSETTHATVQNHYNSLLEHEI